MVVCVDRGADLHTAQLMPLPLTVSCFSKIQIGFTFLVPADSGSSGKGPLNGCVPVCLSILTVRLLIDLVSVLAVVMLLMLLLSILQHLSGSLTAVGKKVCLGKLSVANLRLHCCLVPFCWPCAAPLKQFPAY